MKFGCLIGIFLNSANLICRSTDISKCFRGSLRVRDNESRLYRKCIKTILFDKRGYSEISVFEIISIFHGCMLWIEKSVTRVTDRHHEACRVMPNSDPE